MLHKICLFLIAPLFSIAIAIEPREASAQAGYICDGTGDEIVPGYCYPRPAAPGNVPPAISTALYVKCRVINGGRDRYTANCCDHLTAQLAGDLRVCGGHRNPEQRLGLAIQIGTILGELPMICQWVDCEPAIRAGLSRM